MPRILHVHFKAKHNVGDSAVVKAVRELVESSIGRVAWSSMLMRALREEPTARMLRFIDSHDLVIIGGGGFCSKYALPLNESLVAKIRPPVVLFAIGSWSGIGGWSMLLWGLCARMTYAYHSTWFVNSATHLWGYRNYDTRDESRNLWWVAVVSYGEGWHNNHHAHPSNARAGHKWYEIDPTFWVIKLLKATGLAYDVKDAIPQKA